MVRKAIIVLLTLAAFGTAALWAVSFFTPLTWRSQDLATISWPRTVDEARRPLCFECRMDRGRMDRGRMALGNIYTGCGNPRDKEFRFAGVEFANLWENPGRRTIEKAVLIVPAWPIPILLIVYPALALLFSPTRRRARRRLQGLYTKCGYDLTGNISGACPECGETA